MVSDHLRTIHNVLKGTKFERGLQVPEKSKHYGITSLFKEPIDASKGLVVQYEVKFTEGITCGGAYIKLLTSNSSFQAGDLTNETPYSIMFGPDKCGQPGKVC